ncbi:MAG: hypothetical protein CMI18_06175 [Opitutaceae bacterium]|nr:hypothetical protein [Opitutaceae bacterium]
MPQPKDITGAIFKRKKFQSRKKRQGFPVPQPVARIPTHRLRRIRFSTFSFAIGLLVSIAVLLQFVIVLLFQWI